MKIVAFVGMPGSGKTVAADVARKLKFPVMRLGDLTDEELKARGLERNEINERIVREALRAQYGMDVYAKKAAEKIEPVNFGKNLVVLYGVKSFEEYLFLKSKFGKGFVAVCIIVSPETRHSRLMKRKIRPLKKQDCVSRDRSELENLNEGATIAMSDVFISNEGLTKNEFQTKIDGLLKKSSREKT